MHRLNLIKTLTILSSVCCSSCSVDPRPLRTMGELVALSGVTPSEVSVEEVPYPIEDYDIGSTLDRWCLKPWVLKQLNLYEEWRFSLWVPCA